MIRLTKKLKIWLAAGLTVIILLVAWQIIAGALAKQLKADYLQQQSKSVYDRNHKLIQITPNSRGYYNQFLTEAPKNFSNLLLKKEDRFFYFHPGLNPVSWMRDLFSWIFYGKRTGSSTLTQQLVKTLLQNENERSLTTKIKEIFFTEALETKFSKKEILVMYLNSVYFGNLSQGLNQGARDYFNVPPDNLSNAQILSLLATLSGPSISQPGTSANLKQAKILGQAFGITISEDDWKTLALAKLGADSSRTSETAFEVNSLNPSCQTNCQLTLDSELNENIRQILKRNLTSPALDSAQNGAVVVIKLPENEILSLVGSPDPTSTSHGQQLNMTTRPRAIGSTAKPFIYQKAFEKGARPYSLVNDEEIKYQIGTGFDFFPKNFDGKFRGLVTLHQALDNSLNIPSVQVLEFVGLENFYNFLKKDLGFHPLQPIENYQLGIALGGLEVDPLTLTYYFSLFPENGVLKPLTLYKAGGTAGSYYKAPMADTLTSPKTVALEANIQLVNKILNDRDTGVDQFGIKSNLNLPFTNYGLKTGTSRDYHDSWTVGFTPDFVVGVWVGNSDNRAMRQITGLSGAAKIWREVMEVMYNSDYNKNTPLTFDKIVSIQSGDSLDFGLKNDVYETARNIMLKNNLIITPHQDDKFLLQKGTTIPLSANEVVSWSVDGKFIGKDQKINWPATQTGSFVIEAQNSAGKKEQVTIFINKE